MKTQEEINRARGVLAQAWRLTHLSKEQRANLSGMMVALCWVCDERTGSTLDLILSGEPIQPNEG